MNFKLVKASNSDVASGSLRKHSTSILSSVLRGICTEIENDGWPTEAMKINFSEITFQNADGQDVNLGELKEHYSVAIFEKLRKEGFNVKTLNRYTYKNSDGQKDYSCTGLLILPRSIAEAIADFKNRAVEAEARAIEAEAKAEKAEKAEVKIEAEAEAEKARAEALEAEARAEALEAEAEAKAEAEAV